MFGLILRVRLVLLGFGSREPPPPRLGWWWGEGYYYCFVVVVECWIVRLVGLDLVLFWVEPRRRVRLGLVLV